MTDPVLQAQLDAIRMVAALREQSDKVKALKVQLTAELIRLQERAAETQEAVKFAMDMKAARDQLRDE